MITEKIKETNKDILRKMFYRIILENKIDRTHCIRKMLEKKILKDIEDIPSRQFIKNPLENINHYQLKIKNNDFDVNDILQALDKKMKDNNINCSRIEFNYFSNAIEYLLRSYFKGQKESDLKKAISEIQFILGE